MLEFLKRIAKKTFVNNIVQWSRQRKAVAAQLKSVEVWKASGRPLPPPQLYKRMVIKEYAKKYKIGSFIETGTYLGETVDYFRNYFSKIISIELDLKLYEAARMKFANKKNIEILNGDSGQVIGSIVPSLKERSIFWLDGHYSEGITAKGDLNTPILAELRHVLKNNDLNHIILIDDARCFTGEDDYPSVEALRIYIHEIDSKLQFSMTDDIIRVHY